MTIFENIKSKNIDELVEWLDKNGATDNNPWLIWFDKNYCRKCDAVIIPDEYLEHEYAWCELYNKCRFFQDMNNVPNRKQVIKLWLESESR